MGDKHSGRLKRPNMHSNFLKMMVLFGCVAVALVGCSRKTDTNRDLEKAATTFEKAEPAHPPPPASPAPAQAPQPAPVAAPAAAPAQQLNQALAAYKNGQLDDAVTRLQKLRATATLTPEQRIALNDAMATVMTEIYTLAAKGDARAQQAVKQYEQMQTSRQAH